MMEKEYMVKVNVSASIGAFTASDAEEIVLNAVRDLEGLGVTVIEATVDSVEPV